MSLELAIKAIVEDMEKEMKESMITCCQSLLKSYMKQLNIALKACEQEKVILDPLVERRNTFLTEEAPKKTQEQKEIEKAVLRQDAIGAKMAKIVGGDADGDMIEIDPNMPLGAYTSIGGHRHQLRVAQGGGRALHYTPL